MLASCSARAERGHEGRVFEVTASPVLRHELTLPPGGTSELHTESASLGAAYVLHVWDVAAQRELARDEACAWPGCGARVQVHNGEQAPRVYWVIARARDNRSAGTLDLLRDGKVIARAAAVAGTQLAVARGKHVDYSAAAPPGGAPSASFYALDKAGRLIAIDDGSGPLGLPRLHAPAPVQRLVVASAAAAAAGVKPSPSATTAARLRVYANDPGDDGDGDGLGRALEHALGTCDGTSTRPCARSPLSAFYRRFERATADNDRDGLGDGDELLGVSEGRLDLPRWGADPRHKDAFIEVDYARPLRAGTLSEDDFAAIARLFAAGSARALLNPDGLPGLRLHIDAGFEPANPRRRALLGAWGGSKTTGRRNYKKARDRDFHASRHGYFRYALVTDQGTGQAGQDAFTINRDLARVALFAHELGHTFGLQHHGHTRWGELNCKPNYMSMMGYTYQNSPAVGFSRREGPQLDGSRLDERAPLPSALLKRLAGAPFELDVRRGAGVDWNRNGVIDRVPVRAAPTWATYKSCAAGAVGRRELARDTGKVSPALVRLGERLHVLWTDAAGQLWSRSAPHSGPDGNGSCPLGDGVNTLCAEWSEPRALLHADGAARAVRGVALLPLSAARAAAAYVDGAGAVQLSLASDRDGALELAASVRVSELASDRPPALARMTVDPRFYGTSELLAVFFRAAGTAVDAAPSGAATGQDPTAVPPGTLLQASARTPEGPFALRPLIDQAGQPIVSPFGPSVLRLGTGELCAVFVDREQLTRFYCYAPERDRWIDLTSRAFYSGLGMPTGGEVTLAYHRYRDAEGLPLGGDDSRGAVYLAFTELAPGMSGAADNPNLAVSAPLSAAYGAFEAIDFRWRGALIDQWTHVARNSAVALYEDEALSALKAALITRRDDDGLFLDFLPLADGSFDATLRGGDDFTVMERGICLGLHGTQRCGDATTSHY